MYCQDQAMVDRERLFDWHAVVPRKSSSSHSSHTSQTIGVPSIHSNASSHDASSIPRALSAASNSNSSSASSSQMNITTYPANEEEFAMLPPAIRRKQFSTVERLRLAQQSNIVPNEQKPRSLSAGSNHSKESGSLPRSPRSPHTPNSPLFPKSTGQSPSKSPKNSQEKKVPSKASTSSESTLSNGLILTQSDAQWFLQLGDTIKRKLFTPEERMILQSKCEDMIQNSERSNTPSNSCFTSADFNDSLTTLASVESSKVDNMPVDLAPRPRCNYEPTTVSTSPMIATNPVKTTTRRAIIRESFKWIEDDDYELETQLVLDSLKDINGNIQTTTVEVPDSRRNSRMSSVSRPSIKRTLSLTRCNSNRNSISKFTDSSDWSNNMRARRLSRRSTSQSISVPSSRRVSYAASTPSRRVSMEQDAAFWQDPDARLKLRLYLASAQNFDEALEFGFPSMQDDNKKEVKNISKRPTSEVYNAPECVKSNISFLADDDEDEDDKDSIRSLKFSNTTRYGTRERLHVIKSSTVNSMAPASVAVSAVQVTPDVDLECMGITPLQPRVVKPTFTESGVGGREMTLRMTLTRKDLRADESELYGWQGSNNASNGNNENIAPQACPADFDFPWQADDRNGNKWIVSKIWSKVRHGHGAIPKRC